MTRRLVTSWDDGLALDMKLADLLDRVGARGTFYLSRDTCTLSNSDVRELSERHEIGSHTLRHTYWGSTLPEEWVKDVRDGRSWLEDLLSSPVPGFAYPGGVFDSHAAQLLDGVVGHARTTLLGSTHAGTLGQLHTTVHVRYFPLRHRITGLYSRWAERRPWALRDWPEQAFSAFLGRGDLLHLWGHSWEINEQQLWEELESLLEKLVPFSQSLTVSQATTQ